MGKAVRRTLLLACLLFGGYLVAGLALPEARPAMSSGLALVMAGGGALLVSMVVVAILSGPFGQADDAALQTGDYCIVILAPTEGGPDISPQLAARFQEAGDIMVKSMAGVDTQAILVLPKDWPSSPVAGPQDFSDLGRFERHRKPLGTLLSRKGMPREAIDRLLSMPLTTDVHGPVVSAHAIIPKSPSQPESHEADGPSPKTPLPETPSTSILLFIGLVPLGPVAPPNVVIGKRKMSQITQRVRDALNGSDAPIAPVFPNEWECPALSLFEAALSAPYDVQTRDAIDSALRGFDCEGHVRSAVSRADLLGFEIKEDGLVTFFVQVKTLPSALGELCKRLSSHPKADGASYARPDPLGQATVAPVHELADSPAEFQELNFGADPTGTSFVCDICNDRFPTHEMIRASSAIVASHTEAGYMPARLPDTLQAMAETDARLREAWKMVVEANHTDWGLCRGCADDLDRYAHGE